VKDLLKKLKPDPNSIAKLPDRDSSELLRHLEAIELEQRTNKIWTLYPEEGPLRRELYPKHMQFFAAGGRFRERAAIAGNRCNSPFTPIEMGSSTRLISELIDEKVFYVSSWDGSSRCKKKAGGVFLKGIEPMFRLHLDNGQALDCTCRHRVLTSEGWLDISQLALLSSGLYCFQKAADCLANCGMDSDLYDRQLLLSSNNVPIQLPLQDDARNIFQSSFSLEDAWEHGFRYTHISPGFDRLSSRDDSDLISDLCELFPDPTLQPGALLSSGERQELLLFVDEWLRKQASQRVCSRQPSMAFPHGVGNGRSAAQGTLLELDMAIPTPWQSIRLIASGQSKGEFFRDAARRLTRDCFVPLGHPSLVGGQRINIIEYIGDQPVLDFTVEETHCYESSGVFSHNTGKSFGIGGYETALHLIGEYPSWWKGRRFRRPIDAWAAGDTSETTRDIIQQIMMGNIGELGTGLIPRDSILGQPSHRAGVPGAMDTVRVKHSSGGTSTLGFKCFAAKTMVTMADGSRTPIEDIVPGQKVLCADGSKHDVTEVFHYEDAPLINLGASSGAINVTDNHWMFTARGLVQAGELVIGDRLEMGSVPHSYGILQSITRLPWAPVYCITVDEKHELIANGFRVGNSFDQGRKKFQGTARDVCISEGELVQMADGRVQAIETVAAGDYVLSIDGMGKIVKRKVLEVHCNGERECIEVIPKHGPTIIVTPDHDIYRTYRLNDKTHASSCEVVAHPRPGYFWPSNIEDKLDAFYVWAGLAISEGHFARKRISNTNVAVIEKAIMMLPEFASAKRINHRVPRVPEWRLHWKDFWDAVPNGLSYEQKIPNWIFTSSKEKVILFLRWLFFGDGWASGKNIGYGSTSRTLVIQISILLSRLGIRSSVYIRNLEKHGWREQYWLLIGKSDDVIKFIDEVGIEGKEEACANVRKEAERRLLSKKARCPHLKKTPTGQPQWVIEKNWRAQNRSSKVRGQRAVGLKKVYDLAVEKEHRFICGNLLVSNCWLDESPPLDVYTECLARLITRDGIMLCTFTPLEGISDVVLMFLPELAPDITDIKFDTEDLD
jgi:intein/homing endonuclease